MISIGLFITLIRLTNKLFHTLLPPQEPQYEITDISFNTLDLQLGFIDDKNYKEKYKAQTSAQKVNNYSSTLSGRKYNAFLCQRDQLFCTQTNQSQLEGLHSKSFCGENTKPVNDCPFDFCTMKMKSIDSADHLQGKWKFQHSRQSVCDQRYLTL